MYRYHESREDTIVFREFHQLLSDKTYDSLGDIFEKEEDKQLGPDGFDKILKTVSIIEKKLNIADPKKITAMVETILNK